MNDDVARNELGGPSRRHAPLRFNQDVIVCQSTVCVVARAVVVFRNAGLGNVGARGAAAAARISGTHGRWHSVIAEDGGAGARKAHSLVAQAPSEGAEGFL